MNSPTLQVHTYARISESDTPWSIVICRETGSSETRVYCRLRVDHRVRVEVFR
jgi:hypothetical protein